MAHSSAVVSLQSWISACLKEQRQKQIPRRMAARDDRLGGRSRESDGSPPKWQNVEGVIKLAE